MCVPQSVQHLDVSIAAAASLHPFQLLQQADIFA